MDNLLLLTTIAASSLLGVGASALVVKAMLAVTGRMLQAGGAGSPNATRRQVRRRAA